MLHETGPPYLSGQQAAPAGHHADLRVPGRGEGEEPGPLGARVAEVQRGGGAVPQGRGPEAHQVVGQLQGGPDPQSAARQREIPGGKRGGGGTTTSLIGQV